MSYPTSFNKKTMQPTGQPFNNIGLAFSGGGFRAASFTLGALSYMNEVYWNDPDSDDERLLHRISYISSASGGTITNAAYALSVATARSFDECYKHLFTQLEEVGLLTHVFKILNDDAIWKQDAYKAKRRNLINAFSIAYDQNIFCWPGETKGAKLGALMFNNNASGHLDEVCFNTTEFYRGLLFRQAVKLKSDTESAEAFLYGNFIINVRNLMQQHIRIGDTLAASSCFPAGFEPIVFPTDFANDTLSGETLLSNTRIQPQELSWEELEKLFTTNEIESALEQIPVPINVETFQKNLLTMQDDGKINKAFETGFMDGGITDNQGIDSLMRANKRREDGVGKNGQNGATSFKPFDLMMTNDVGSHYMDAYTPLPKKDYKGFMNLGLSTIKTIALVTGIIGLGLILGGIALSNVAGVILAAAGSLLMATGFGVAGILSYLRRFISRKTKNGGGLNLDKNFSEYITKKFLRFFGGTPIGVLITMLKERSTSILSLNNDVFLKRIRQLLYERILDEGRACFRMKTNHVYDLAYINDINRLDNDGRFASLAPTPAIQNVAQCAFEMATTLWFSKDDKVKNYNEAALIATGHVTTCYNMLLFIYRMKEHPTDAQKQELPSFYDGLAPQWQQKTDHLQAQMEAHYEQFKQDPFWLYNKIGVRCNIPGFTAAHTQSYPFPEGYKRLR